MSNVRIPVRSGDTLGSLARRHGTTVAALAKANGITNVDRIAAGTTLVVPAGRPTATVPMAADRYTPSTTCGPDATAEVVPGYTAREVEILTRAVAAEARGESPAVWAQVATTIATYARKNKKALAKLCRSSYLSSNFDGNRVYYTRETSRIPRYEAMRDTVVAALTGKVDTTERLHFHDVSISTPRFGDRDSAFRVGRMVFYNPK